VSARSAGISGIFFNLGAGPTKHYRRAASLRNIFRNFMAWVNTTDLSLAIAPPRKSRMLPHDV
jgi:hypothetical protein